MKHYRRVMTIAGSDSGGGAGIQADLKTFSALGCYGSSVITALTAQNTKKVTAIQEMPDDFIEQQFCAIAEDIGFDAIKIGMLYQQSIIEVVRHSLLSIGPVPLVIDPVMVATSGDMLLDISTVSTLLATLLPMATLVTPNIPEAELLVGKKIPDKNSMESVAKELANKIQTSVLLKGGHLDSAICWNYLYDFTSNVARWYQYPRINTVNTHGTGCSLSSAIAAYLAKGESLMGAVEEGIDYVHHALFAGKNYSIGQGNGPIHHYYKYW